MMLENHVIREKELEDIRDYQYELMQPQCCCCQERIFDEWLYEVAGDKYCEFCFEEMFKVDTSEAVYECCCCENTNKEYDISFYNILDDLLCEDCIEDLKVKNEHF